MLNKIERRYTMFKVQINGGKVEKLNKKETIYAITAKTPLYGWFFVESEGGQKLLKQLTPTLLPTVQEYIAHFCDIFAQFKLNIQLS